MKVTLVQPPLLERGRESLNPPLGLLTLGAVLREESVDVTIVDFNLKGFQNPRLLDPSTFYDAATAQIAATDPDVVGFTSMALESHVGLELAHLLKQQDPGVKTLFGGAHYGAIARDLLAAYPWTDFVVAGEAERAITDLFRYLRGHGRSQDLLNVAYRDHDRIALNARRGGNLPLNEHPFPGHDLVRVQDYFEINPYRLLCIEHARGCQLRCSFCYSEAHWGHGERTKSLERTVEELAELSRLGAHNAFFVADNFVTNGKVAERYSAAFREANLPIRWTCYATLAQLKPATVEAMAGAGCHSVFVGVDAVSSTNRKDFRKTYYKGWRQLRTSLEVCMDAGIRPTCSFMLAGADSRDGLEDTLRTALLTQTTGAHAMVNALSFYNLTESDRRRQDAKICYNELKTKLLFDTPALNRSNEYARAAPWLFPMHQATPASGTDLDLSVVAYLARELIERCPVSMSQYAFTDHASILGCIEALAGGALAGVLTGIRLDDEPAVFLAFVETLRATLSGNPALPALVDFDLLPHSLPRQREPVHIDLVVDGMSRRCLLRPYVAARLPAGPRNLATTDLDRPTRPIIATWAHGGRYALECDPSIPLLSALHRAEPIDPSLLRVNYQTYCSLVQTRIALPVLPKPITHRDGF